MTKAVGSVIQEYYLSTTDWTAIIAPADCSYWMFLRTNNRTKIGRCSDDKDAGTCYWLDGYDWITFSCPALYKKFRFAKGDTVTFLKATAENTIAYFEFYN